MNKFFKITVVAAVTLTAAGVFAAPPRHHKPAPKKHHVVHHVKHAPRNTGLQIAANIANIVNTSINILTGTPPPPPPQPKTIIINNNRPKPPTRVIINNNPHHPKPQPHKRNAAPPHRGRR